MDNLIVAAVILDTMMEVGADGVPSGILYAGLMGRVGLDQYQTVIGGLEGAGMLTCRSHVLRLTDAGKERAEAVHKVFNAHA